MTTGKALLTSLLACVLAASPVAAQDITDHADFTRILEGVVQAPRVDYAALQDRRADLAAYLDQLAGTDLAALESAPDDVQLAF